MHGIVLEKKRPWNKCCSKGISVKFYLVYIFSNKYIYREYHHHHQATCLHSPMRLPRKKLRVEIYDNLKHYFQTQQYIIWNVLAIIDQPSLSPHINCIIFSLLLSFFFFATFSYPHNIFPRKKFYFFI